MPYFGVYDQKYQILEESEFLTSNAEYKQPLIICQSKNGEKDQEVIDRIIELREKGFPLEIIKQVRDVTRIDVETYRKYHIRATARWQYRYGLSKQFLDENLDIIHGVAISPEFVSAKFAQNHLVDDTKLTMYNGKVYLTIEIGIDTSSVYDMVYDALNELSVSPFTRHRNVHVFIQPVNLTSPCVSVEKNIFNIWMACNMRGVLPDMKDVLAHAVSFVYQTANHELAGNPSETNYRRMLDIVNKYPVLLKNIDLDCYTKVGNIEKKNKLEKIRQLITI
jgi:hypothetical protein